MPEIQFNTTFMKEKIEILLHNKLINSKSVSKNDKLKN